MSMKDLTTKLAVEKIEQMTGKVIEIEDLGYKFKVSAFDKDTYISKDVAVVSSKRELIVLLSGMLYGAEHRKENLL